MPTGHSVSGASVEQPSLLYRKSIIEQFRSPQTQLELMRHSLPVFSQIDEYTQLQTRLKHSLTRHMMKFESIRAGICHEVLDSEATLDGLQMKLESIEIAGLWDNRDYSILPNHQPTNAKPVELQTRTGPRTDARWLKALWSIYHAYSTNSAIPGDLTLDGGCSTSREMAFLEWAKRIASWLSGSQADMEDATFVGFFKDCHSELQSATLDTPTWELLHTAQLALEAYSLLDVAFRVMSRSSTAANAKQIKLFKRLRQDLKPIMKAISTRLKALVEDMSKRYKGRNKVEGLLPLFGAEAKVSLVGLVAILAHCEWAFAVLRTKLTPLPLAPNRSWTSSFSTLPRNLWKPERPALLSSPTASPNEVRRRDPVPVPLAILLIEYRHMLYVACEE